MIELRTQRLLLRQWRSDDREPFAALTSDPKVMSHFPATLTRRQSDALADRFEALIARTGWGMWALEERSSGRFVGFTGIAPPRFEASFLQMPEIGWRLLHEAWGKGYASEAARAAAAYAFDVLEATELMALATTANARSRAVMERLGMRRDRTHDRDHPLSDERGVQHHVLYRLRRHELVRNASDRPVPRHGRS